MYRFQSLVNLICFSVICLPSVFVDAQVCPFGWLDRYGGDSCYKIITGNVKYSWTEARLRCQQLESKSFKLETVQEKIWLLRTLANITSVFSDATEWWTGMTNKGNGSAWTWASDNTRVDMSLIKWAKAAPTPAPGRRCATVSGSGFDANGCDGRLRIICERSKQVPLKCNTDNGWQYSNGSCFKYFGTKRSFDDASGVCKRKGGHLSVVTGDDSQRFLWDTTRTHQTDSWLGLRATVVSGAVQWIWDNQVALTKGPTYWSPLNPNTTVSDANNTCVMLLNSGKRKQSWMKMTCAEMKPFMCQKASGRCYENYLLHQDYCFAFNPIFSLPWDQAQNYCRGQGATLLKITNAADQQFINLYLSDQAGAGVNNIWIGATDNSSNSGPFVWGDGSKIGPYKHWAPKYPKNAAGKQDCSFIDTGDSSGRWQTSGDCTQRKSFVCMIPSNVTPQQITTPAPTFFCDPGWVANKDICYQFNTTEVKWVVARDACLSQSATLVTIMNAQQSEFVAGKATGADFWIGLQDRNKEGGWTWVNNVTLSYKHWNVNEPNNLGNENCAAVLGRWSADKNGKWNDYACSRQLGFICQKSANNKPGRTTLAPTKRPIYSKKCGAFWEESPGSDWCYLFSSEMLTWSDARDTCEHRGGKLTSITSPIEQSYISGRIRTINVAGMWTGANDIDSEGGWTWQDGSPFAYMNWSPGEPNDYGRDEDCSVIFTKTALWNDFSCLRRYGFICKKLGNIRATTSAPTTSPNTVPAGKFYGCKPGWKPYLNNCYLLVTNKTSWANARTTCRREGGDLASVGNALENKFINSQIQREECVNIYHNNTKCEEWAKRGECQKNPIWMANNCKDSCALCEYVCADQHTQRECAVWADLGECKKNPEWMHIHCALSCGRCEIGFNAGAWIGLNDLKTTDNFVWTDDSRVTFTNWGRNEPNNFRGNQEHCVVLYTNGGKWNDDGCTKPFGYACKMKKQVLAVTQKSPFQVGCSQGALGSGHFCYQFVTTPLSWTNAQGDCQRRKGSLATVNSYLVQSFVSAELVGKSDAFWIGLSDLTTPGNYTWTTGEKLAYTPWDRSHNGSERSTCVAMRATQPIGLWKNFRCSVLKPYICQLPRAGFTAPTTTTPPTTAAPLPCASGWDGYGPLCYKAFRMGATDRKTWSEALLYCQGYGGDLASIHSSNMEHFLETRVLRHFYNAIFWIGLNDQSREGSYVWSDRTPFEYSNWFRGEPNNVGNSEDCAEYSQYTKKWNDNNCNAAKDFICEIPRGVTVPTTTVKTTTPLISCVGAESGWDYYNGSCYFVSQSWGHTAKKTWYEARRFCMAEGGDLASIHNLQENDYLTAIVTKRTQRVYWIGLNKVQKDNYAWSDGSPVDFAKWKIGEPNNAFGGQLCVDLYGGSMDSAGSWNDDNCMDLNGYICKRFNGTVSTNVPSPTPTIPGGCPASFYPFDNKCFGFGGLTAIGMLNWTDARAQCRKQGQHFEIASVNNYAQQAYLVTLLKQLRITSPVWIGFFDMHVSGHYQWQDNTEVAFTNWNQGEPSDTYHHYGRAKEDCVSMLVQPPKLAGRWNDEQCSLQRPYLCQTFKSTTYSTPSATSSVCIPGYRSFGTSCYKLVTPPKNWQDGLSVCQNDGGSLVSITDTYEQAFIDTLIHLNGVTSPVWIGLSDKKTTGIYGWQDGWPMVYTRWGQNEPSRGPGEGCIAQQALIWNDTLCALSYPYICEIDSTTPPPTTPMPPGFCPDSRMTAHGDFCYYADSMASQSWPEANFLCQQMGMDLISIHSQADMDFLKVLLEQPTTTQRYHYYRTKPAVWMGLLKGKSGGFTWSDGSSANFFPWAPGEPSDVNGTQHENCVEYFRDRYTWNDVPCLTKRAYACKTRKTYPSTTPPTTTTATTKPSSSLAAVSVPKGNSPGKGGPVTYSPQYNGTTRDPPSGNTRQQGNTGQQKQNNGSSTDLSPGAIAGILIGVVVFLLIIVIVVLVFRRRMVKPSSPVSGFDNAMYSKDSEHVSVSNGKNDQNIYSSGIPDGADC